MWFSGIKIAFFLQKITKNCPTAGGFAPRPPSVIRLSYTGFLKTSPKLRICTFQLYQLRLSPFAKSWLSANRQIFDDVIACDLWFRPPQLKILATPKNWRLPEKLFWRLFFVENTCGCVLGPWPRECLSSERLSLALASNFFVSLALASSLVSSTPPLVSDH